MNISYEDEIPPTPTQSPRASLFRLTPKTMLIIGAGVLVVIFGIVLLFLSNRNTLAPLLQRLSARLDTTLEIIEAGHGSVRSADLRKISSDARILTKGNITSLNSAFTSAGMGGVPGDIRAAEADTATLETIDQAKTSGIFDQTYRRVLEQKLATVLVLMREVYESTSNQALRATLDDAYTDFALLHEQLSELQI